MQLSLRPLEGKPGRPKTPNPTTTDPTPHSCPSDPSGLISADSTSHHSACICSEIYSEISLRRSPLAGFRQEKRAQRLTSWFRRPGWGRGLLREGVVPEKFVPSFESFFSLGFQGWNLGCPGNFAGMFRTPGSVRKVCAEKVRAHVSASCGSFYFARLFLETLRKYPLKHL